MSDQTIEVPKKFLEEWLRKLQAMTEETEQYLENFKAGRLTPPNPHATTRSTPGVGDKEGVAKKP